MQQLTKIIDNIQEIVKETISNLQQLDELNRLLYTDYEYKVEPLEVPHKEHCPTIGCTVRTEINDRYYINVRGSDGLLEKCEVILKPHALKNNIPKYETVLIYWRIRSGELRVKPLAIIASVEICGAPTCLAEKMVKLVYESVINLNEYLSDVLSKISTNNNVDSTEARLG